MNIKELSNEENIILEAAQESGIITAEIAAKYAEENNIPIMKEQATRILSKLTTMGLLKRRKRDSRGWGLGWYPSIYEINK